MTAVWPRNLGRERGWNFTALPNPHLNGRGHPDEHGQGAGGGSSINVMLWACGHQPTGITSLPRGDPTWSYDSVLAIYREIENWQGGRDGLLYITQPI